MTVFFRAEAPIFAMKLEPDLGLPCCTIEAVTGILEESPLLESQMPTQTDSRLKMCVVSSGKVLPIDE